ncbi:hypothetical protein L7F22_025058 [Adiantum nelumboides]|nr:hypothetical protein [Adiantum nelumboides]
MMSGCFAIEGSAASQQRQQPASMEKRHLLFVPAMLFGSLILYVILFSPSWFRLPASSADGPKLTELLVAEQRSLALLREQAQGLYLLWNSISNSSEGDMLKDQIASQIKLNNEAQQVLLSPYQQNINVSGYNDKGLRNCQPAESPKYKVKEGLPWKPKRDRFLFAICTSGQFSNHLVCIEKHMFFAALLGRKLILPSSDFDYNYERVLNISHIKTCLGKGDKIITFSDFLHDHNGRLHVNRFICYMHDCYLDKDHEEKLKRLGVSWEKKEEVWPHDPDYPSHPQASEIVEKFTSDDEVIGVGDLFYADVESNWVNQVGGPLLHKCRNLIQPHNYIIATAERFIQTYLGKNFVGLHFRRYGFLTFCNENSKRGHECHFYPIPQAAECIWRIVSATSARVIYLSTDAKASETNLLQSLLYKNGLRISLVTRPDHESGEKWDSPLARHGLLNDKEVIAMLDKTICAMSNTFLGSLGSTFSADILRMRAEWGAANSCDQYLCGGEEPDFVASLN